MKYKILRPDGDYDFHNDSTITELPYGAISLTDEEWENRLISSSRDQFILAKQNKLNQIMDRRLKFQNQNIIIDGKEYISTESAKNRLWALIYVCMASDYPLEWRLADSITWVTLDKDQATELCNAMKEQEKSAYKQETMLIIAVNNATTIEELDAINIDFN